MASGKLSSGHPNHFTAEIAETAEGAKDSGFLWSWKSLKHAASLYALCVLCG
jgi:hypothetical protein